MRTEPLRWSSLSVISITHCPGTFFLRILRILRRVPAKTRVPYLRQSAADRFGPMTLEESRQNGRRCTHDANVCFEHAANCQPGRVETMLAKAGMAYAQTAILDMFQLASRLLLSTGVSASLTRDATHALWWSQRMSCLQTYADGEDLQDSESEDCEES